MVVGEGADLHKGAHVQAVLGPIELIAAGELHPGDGDLKLGVPGLVVDGQLVADLAGGDLWALVVGGSVVAGSGGAGSVGWGSVVGGAVTCENWSVLAAAAAGAACQPAGSAAA